MSPETLKLILTFLGSAVVVKALDIAYAAYARRRDAKAKSSADLKLEGIETKRLTLDEVAFVVKTQQDEIGRLSVKVERLEKELEQRDDDAARRARDYEGLTERYTALLRWARELQRSAGVNAPPLPNLSGEIHRSFIDDEGGARDTPDDPA